MLAGNSGGLVRLVAERVRKNYQTGVDGVSSSDERSIFIWGSSVSKVSNHRLTISQKTTIIEFVCL